MSVSSWEKEFYRVKSYELARRENVTNKQLVQQSLKKWIGFLASNLKKHKITCSDLLCEYECSLCDKYRRPLHQSIGDRCTKCPLKSQLGRPCYESTEQVDSPWYLWSSDRNPRPMINALRKTLKSLSKK